MDKLMPGKSPKQTSERFALMALELFVAVSALPVGSMLAWRPDGSLVGLPLKVLDGSPFGSFLIPGLVLAFVVGGGALAGFVLLWARHRNAYRAVLASGILLSGWIVVQVGLLGYLSILQPIFLLIGLLLCGLSWRRVRGGA